MIRSERIIMVRRGYKPFRRLPEYRRYNTYVVFALKSGEVVASLEHEEPLPEALARITKNIAGRPYYVLKYPKLISTETFNNPSALPRRMNVSGCASLECAFPVDEVLEVWTQRRGQN